MRALALCLWMLACADELAPPAPAATSACRTALTCALLCEGGDCRSACFGELEERDLAASAEALACIDRECPAAAGAAARGACAAETCGAAVVGCYFPSPRGTATCAATWRCFGACGDNESCLADCAAAIRPEEAAAFVDVELCSDHYVAFTCAEAGDACDQEALSGACAPALRACLAPGLAPEAPWMRSFCTDAPSRFPPTPEACLISVREVLAACPVADAEALARAGECAAAGRAGCAAFSPSPLCLEILGSPGSAQSRLSLPPSVFDPAGADPNNRGRRVA